MANWWETLGNPTLTSELKERLAAGITAETAGRGIAELADWRDRFLVDLLAIHIGAHRLVGSIAVVSRSPLSSAGPLRAHSLVASSERGC